MLRRLSIFVFGLSRDMACTIASDIGTSKSDAVEALAGLVAKSLLNADANTSVRTYRLLETTLVRTRRAAADLQREEIACRHAEHLVHRFATAEAGIFPTPAPGQFADFTALIDDVRAAVAWASSPDGDVAIESRAYGGNCAAVDPFVAVRGVPQPCRARPGERGVGQRSLHAAGDAALRCAWRSADLRPRIWSERQFCLGARIRPCGAIGRH